MTALQPSEAAFQSAVVDLALLRGWLAFHVHDARRGLGAGYPDLTLVHPRTGEVIWAELKTHKGRVSQQQQRWLDALAAGGHAAHVWRPGHLHTGQIARALTPSDVGRTA